jgi:hypothetical protein
MHVFRTLSVLNTSLLLLFLTCSYLCAQEREAGLLFELSYDAWSVNADYAAGRGKCISFENPDLQLRMFPGIDGKGNALCMDNREAAIYDMPGNFNPANGSVSMWVSPRDWRVNDEKWQIFFEAFQKDFRMLVYKYMSPQLLIFYIQAPGPDGKKQVYMARTMLEDKDWQPGSWHKIDVAWNAEGMKLYVDGVMPEVYYKNSQRRIPQLDFNTPPQLPQAATDGKLVIGTHPRSQKNPATDPDRKTAYDEIKIYDRPLSPEEIRKAYEKHFPPKAVQDEVNPLASIPRTTLKPVIDGNIDADEWKDAAAMPIARFGNFQLPGSCPDAVAFCKYDDEHLYVAMSAKRPWTRKKHTHHDGNIWEDDSFELLLFDDNGNTCHLIVNGNGALFDERNSDKAWNSGARAAAAPENGRSVEIALPLSAIPGFKAGAQWKGNFCATYYQPNGKGIYSSWSQMHGGSYDNVKGFGELVVVPDNAAVRLLSLGRPAAGHLDVVFDTTSPAFRERFAFTGLCTSETPVILTPGKPWSTVVPGGMHLLRFNATTKDGKAVFRYDYPFNVDNPLSASHACYYLRKVIEMRIDLNNSGDENIKILRDKGFKGKVELKDQTGKVLSAVEFTAKDVVSMVELPFPEDFPTGNYEIVCTVETPDGQLESTSSFIVPDMTPFKERVAFDREVPPPWVPVRRTGDMSFAVLDREYTWNGSPFPASIKTLGEQILSSPIVMNCNGAAVKWTDFKVTEIHNDCVVLSGQGNADELDFSWRGELWYDGAYKLQFTMEPGKSKSVKVNSLVISWSMPREYAEFVLNPLYMPWGDDGRVSIGPAPDMTALSREHIFWLTGHRLGLSWWPESKANWFNNNNEKPISATRKGQQVDVVLKLISRTAELKSKAGYTMAFTATPVKPRPERWRAFNDGNPRIAKGSTGSIGGWGAFVDNLNPSDTTTPASHVPRDSETYGKVASTTVYQYSMPAQLGSNEPEYDYFVRTWAKIPAHLHHLSKGGVKYILQPCCGNTEIADLMAWRIDDFFKKYPRAGFYYDVGGSGFCENHEHGHGGIDVFGQAYLSSTAWGLRQYLQRVYKIHKRHGKTFFYHNHSYFNPVCHVFTDYFYPGEQYCRQTADYKRFYCEGISLEEYQSELNSFIKGSGLVFLPQYGRAAAIMPSMKHMAKEFQDNPEWTLRMLTPLLLHDLNVSASWCDRKVTIPKWWSIKDKIDLSAADFKGYWTSPGASSGSPDVLVSVYSWKKPSPYRHLLVVGNIRGVDRQLDLKLNDAVLGIDNATKFTELWNDQSLSREELRTKILKAYHFMLIGIE